jgi:fructokinase
VKLSQKGKDIIQMPAIKIDKVMDSTGAGDAFGLDFICFIKEKSINECLDRFKISSFEIAKCW